MHRAVLLASGPEIEPAAIMLDGGVRPAAAVVSEAIGADASGGETPGALVGRTVAQVERDLIINTLNHCLGNRTHAANILGISIRTLRNKLKQYGAEGAPIPRPREAMASTY
jgi:DNA-binding NtrC family response regulator